MLIQGGLWALLHAPLQQQHQIMSSQFLKKKKVLITTAAYLHNVSLNPFPQDKILDQTKLKAFADDKLNVTKMIISVFDRVENTVGKGEIACTSNFSFSHSVFQKASFPDVSKRVIVWEWVKWTI